MDGILPPPAEAETEEEMFTMPTIDNLVVLAAVLDVPMDEITGSKSCTKNVMYLICGNL